MMDTAVDEIADRIYRLSTFMPQIGPAGFTFNQYLIDDEEPLLFHTGPRAMFPSTSGAVATVLPVARLRWLTFGHLESDESGAMNDFLAAAPQAEDVFGATCLTPRTGPTIRKLAELAPTTLALMHGSCFRGDGGGALLALADDYDRRLEAALSS